MRGPMGSEMAGGMISTVKFATLMAGAAAVEGANIMLALLLNLAGGVAAFIGRMSERKENEGYGRARKGGTRK